MSNITILGMHNMRESIAKHLLETEAIKIRLKEPYEMADGKKTPFECDLRMLFSYTESRKYLFDRMLNNVFDKHFSEQDIDNVAGIAHGGTQWATLLSDKLHIGMVEVFSSQREEKQPKKMEGKLQGKKRTIVIEDFINDAKGTAEAIETLLGAGADIAGMIVIYSHLLPEAIERLSMIRMPIHVMCDFETLIQVAQTDNHLEQSHDVEYLKSWRSDPDSWDESKGRRHNK